MGFGQFALGRRLFPLALSAVAVGGLGVAELSWARSLDTKLSPFLSVTVSPAASGTVSDLATKDACTTSCRWGYGSAAGAPPPTAVSLSASPASGYTISSWSAPGCGSAASCSVPLSPNGGSVTVSFVQAPAPAPTPNPTPPPPSEADLALVKTVDRATATVGDTLVYTLTVSNRGPAAATAVTVTDQLPDGIALTSAAPGAGSCGGTSTVTCGVGDLAAGASTTIRLVTVASAAGVLVNRASAAGGQTDPTLGNESATATATVAPKPPPARPVTPTPTTPVGGQLPTPVTRCAWYGTVAGDVLVGGLRDDSACGLDGPDRMWGGGGRDGLLGGPGADELVGGPGADDLEGGGGPDRIRACDGERDTVDGGPGYDRAWVDAVDTTTGLEEVHACRTNDLKPSWAVLDKSQ